MTVFNSEEYRPVVKPADTADLKPAAVTHEGSTPSGPTKNHEFIELIAKINWSGRYQPILRRLLELPGAMSVVTEELAVAPSIQSSFSKQLDLTQKQSWESIMPASELPVAVGQRRMFFIDGVGDLDGTITAFDNDACWILVDGDEAAWWVPWDGPGMSHVGVLIGGEEHKKLLEEADAQSQSPSNA